MSYRTTRAFERDDSLPIPRELWRNLLRQYAASVMGISVAHLKELEKIDWDKALKDSNNTDPDLN